MNRQTLILKPLLLACAIAALAACTDSTPVDGNTPAPPADTAPPVNDGTAPPPPMDDDDGTADDGTPDDNTDDDSTDDDDMDDDDDASATIPDRFRGEWNSHLADCGTANNESKLIIGANSVQFYEASGQVQSVDADGNELEVAMVLTGEGVTRDANYTWRLSDDGKTLTDASLGLARQRCGG